MTSLLKNPTILFAGDALVYFLAFFLAVFLRSGLLFSYQFFNSLVIHFAILFLAWSFFFYAFRLYEYRALKSDGDFIRHSFFAFSLSIFLSVLYFYFLSSSVIAPKVILVYFLFLFSAFWYGWRILYRLWLRLPAIYEKIALVGLDDLTTYFIQDVQRKSSINIRVACVFAPEPVSFHLDENIQVCATLEDFRDKLAEACVKFTVIAPTIFAKPEILQRLLNYLPFEMRFLDLSAAYEQFFCKINLDVVEADWFLRAVNRPRDFGYELSKRVLDVFVGLTGMVLIAAFLPLLFLAIKLEDGGAVFFRQKRKGRDGKEFFLYKFRTMIPSADALGTLWAQEGDTRFTKVGTVLRRFHIDEFPQAANLLCGNMSFVGPRAERTELAELFEKEIPFYRIRHSVKPGITGWAQLNFPASASVAEAKEKLEYDIYYIKHRSFFFDLAILFKTITLIFLRQNRNPRADASGPLS